MGMLLLLFIAVPAVELVLLIEIGQRIGTLETLGLIVLTGVIGASLARQQGLRVLTQIRERVALGDMPADPMIDGLMILVASALLVTPGILTDLAGFLLLIPGCRALVKREAARRFERAVEVGRVQVHVQGRTTHHDTGPVIDVTPPDRKP